MSKTKVGPHSGKMSFYKSKQCHIFRVKSTTIAPVVVKCFILFIQLLPFRIVIILIAGIRTQSQHTSDRL